MSTIFLIFFNVTSNCRGALYRIASNAAKTITYTKFKNQVNGQRVISTR